MGPMSDRADKFAAKLANQPTPDPRAVDEKLAEFSKEFDPVRAMKNARRGVRGSNAQ